MHHETGICSVFYMSTRDALSCQMSIRRQICLEMNQKYVLFLIWTGLRGVRECRVVSGISHILMLTPPQILQQLEQSPPDALRQIQSNLVSLYPEWDICYMPADALQPEGGDEDEPLSAFVGNAVMHSDPSPSWHVDADPACLAPTSPWVHHHGYYYNRCGGLAADIATASMPCPPMALAAFTCTKGCSAILFSGTLGMTKAQPAASWSVRSRNYAGLLIG